MHFSRTRLGLVIAIMALWLATPSHADESAQWECAGACNRTSIDCYEAVFWPLYEGCMGTRDDFQTCFSVAHPVAADVSYTMWLSCMAGCTSVP
jgi:hypothetical protein